MSGLLAAVVAVRRSRALRQLGRDAAHLRHLVAELVECAPRDVVLDLTMKSLDALEAVLDESDGLTRIGPGYRRRIVATKAEVSAVHRQYVLPSTRDGQVLVTPGLVARRVEGSADPGIHSGVGLDFAAIARQAAADQDEAASR